MVVFNNTKVAITTSRFEIRVTTNDSGAKFQIFSFLLLIFKTNLKINQRRFGFRKKVWIQRYEIFSITQSSSFIDFSLFILITRVFFLFNFGHVLVSFRNPTNENAWFIDYTHIENWPKMHCYLSNSYFFSS